MTESDLVSPCDSRTGDAPMRTVASTESSHIARSGPATSTFASAWVVDGPASSELQPAAVAAVALFVTTVVAANVLTARHGLIPVGFGLTATAGSAAAGFALLAPDWVHHRAGGAAVLACITLGAVISGGLAGPRPAMASARGSGPVVAVVSLHEVGTGGHAAGADTRLTPML